MMMVMMMVVTTPPAVVVMMVVMPVPTMMMMMMMPLCKLHRPLVLRLAGGRNLICRGKLAQRIRDRSD